MSARQDHLRDSTDLQDPRPPRIAVVTETFPPEVNGVAMSIGRICDGLRRRGVPLQIVRPRQSRDAHGPQADFGPDLVLMPGIRVPGYSLLRVGLPFFGRRLERTWRLQRPDIVHIVTEGPLGWTALNVARRMAIRVSSSFHTNFDSYTAHYGAAPLQGAVRAYLRLFHNRTRVTIVPTAQKRLELSRLGIRRLAVVGRGADAAQFDPALRSRALRETLGAAEASPVVLHVGRLAAEKNLDLLFAAFVEIRHLRPDARLVVVGDGPERARLERSYPGHYFAGTRTGTELARFYASADLFLYPSLTETYGNVTLEAMASGLAVLAFDYAAAHEHIRQRENGFLAPYGDAASFISLAGEMAQASDGLRPLRQRARASAERLGWDGVVDTFLDTLGGAMAPAAAESSRRKAPGPRKAALPAGRTES